MENILEIINIVVVLVGFGIVVFYLRVKLDAYKEILKGYEIKLSSLESFINIFNTDEVKKYVELRIESTNLEKEKEIEKIKQEAIENVNNEKIKSEETKSQLTVEINDFMIFIIDVLIHARIDFRKKIEEILEEEEKKVIIRRLGIY